LTHSLDATLQKYPSFLLDLYIGMVAKLVSTSRVVEPFPLKTQQKCPIHESMNMMHLSKHAQPHPMKHLTLK